MNSAKRLVSLDVFRGLTMAFMVLVGNPGSEAIYRQLDHAPWHGWTATDLVFPTFLWIVGFSVHLSMERQMERGRTWRAIIISMLKRSAVLFGLGVALYAIADFHLQMFRAMGVLQRIAICSLSVAAVSRLGLRQQVAILCVILAGYAAVLRWVPAPGYGAGDLSVNGNIAHFVDRVSLGRHNYAGTGDWDPEGVLSTLPAIATTLLGLMTARVFQKVHRRASALTGMLLAGAFLVASGLLLGEWQPINKKLWTSSFVLFAAGFDVIAFVLLYWIIDRRQHHKGLALPLAFGQNALAIYLVSEAAGALLYRIHVQGRSLHAWVFDTVFRGATTPRSDSLLYACCFLAVVTTFAVVAQRKRWILKL